MTWTLANLTYKVASQIPNFLFEGTATGGSTTTIIDINSRKTDNEPDDFWVDGTAWILKDAAGASAAPEGEYSAVQDFTSTTGTITLTSALTVAAASGDRYAISKRRYSQQLLIQSVNKAIADLGKVWVVDSTSVTTADSQTEYEIPIAANQDLRQVWMQFVDDDTNDNRWYELYNWRVQPTTTGSASVLVFPYQLPADYALQLHYVGEHSALYTYSDKLSDKVPWERIVYRAAWDAMRFKQRSNNALLVEQINSLAQLASDAEINHPIVLPELTTRIIQPVKSFISTDIDKVNLS
jgi:hypothetical protein